MFGRFGLGKGHTPSGKLKTTLFGLGYGEDYNSQKALEKLTKDNYSSQKALNWPQVPYIRTTCLCQILLVISNRCFPNFDQK